jgi:hypothetical protein
LADYAEITGINLSKSPFAAMLEQANTPEAILVLLQERHEVFRTYRDHNRTLIRCLSPAVEVLHAFSGIFGEAVSRERHIPPCESFNVALSDLLHTSKSRVHEY